MLRRFLALCATFSTVIAVGCSSSDSPTQSQPDPETDASVGEQDAEIESAVDEPALDAPGDVSKAAQCASTFGNALTSAYGRIDGTVLAVVGTKDTQCPTFNDDHLLLEVLMNGQVYRMVASVMSTYGDPNVGLFIKKGPLAGPPWEEGWHTNVAFDYVNTFNVHSTDFVGHPMAELEALVTNQIQIGSRVSVYATSEGRPDSAHLIHRNKTNRDGAIAIDADLQDPIYLLFRFANQTF